MTERLHFHGLVSPLGLLDKSPPCLCWIAHARPGPRLREVSGSSDPQGLSQTLSGNRVSGTRHQVGKTRKQPARQGTGQVFWVRLWRQGGATRFSAPPPSAHRTRSILADPASLAGAAPQGSTPSPHTPTPPRRQDHRPPRARGGQGLCGSQAGTRRPGSSAPVARGVSSRSPGPEGEDAES
ncbi:unnamed protein product [Rangifer tarandus platyrhynchus]|uniref:Uncharacterized protein n=2 Tax=Rangifer tarandus platyrhynchus TaxID=3082113 RepID=A0ABN8YXP6_RANTA|nr:unnamed protein product [Rangifer tarandus platyrhynchus]